LSGFYAIGMCHGKTVANLGTLWRSASIFGADFIFTVGRRYSRQASDTMKTWRSIPLFHFATITDLRDHLPFDCRLVGVELDELATPIEDYVHPSRCCYLLGAEDHGLTTEELSVCHQLVRLPGERSMNVAVAGSIVIFDRQQKALVGR